MLRVKMAAHVSDGLYSDVINFWKHALGLLIVSPDVHVCSRCVTSSDTGRVCSV